MTLSLANRSRAIRDHLNTFSETVPGFGYFDVKLTRPGKRKTRQIQIAWTVFPFEETVIEMLGDLYADDVLLSRRQMWTCGIFHADAMEAWKAHEGNHHLEYEGEDSCCGPDYMAEKVLPEHVQEELESQGETFESECRPGNYVHCPTCGGGARLLDRSNRKMTFTPCPTCVDFGLDRNYIGLGIFDLDVPEQRAFYEARIGETQAKAKAESERAQSKRDEAMQQPTTFADPTWKPLPTREAGILAGYPVAERVGCDYLKNANNPDRSVRCDNEARWFDTNTGLRMCTKHKNKRD